MPKPLSVESIGETVVVSPGSSRSRSRPGRLRQQRGLGLQGDVHGVRSGAASELPQVGANGKASTIGTTVPLAKQSPTTALFTALGIFQSCLAGQGVTFIGAPSASVGPNAGVNNPAYLKSLTTCAAQSNILQALKTAQSAQDNLTLAQIKTENKDYLKFRTCMIAKGWKIPAPVPNSKGLLFSFGGTSAPNFTPPPGQSSLSSPDLQACAAKIPQSSS